MSFDVDGFGKFTAELTEWADEMDDPNVTQAKKSAMRRVRREFIDLIQDNIDTIPHNLQSLRESWKYAKAKHGEVEVYTEKHYAPYFEYGAEPYTIEGNPLAIDVGDWDGYRGAMTDGTNPQAPTDGTVFYQRVEHPGFQAYFYFTNAFNEMDEGGIFADIVEEEFADELQEAFD